MAASARRPSSCSADRPWQRARAGLFLALQYPIEVPGVGLEAELAEAPGRRTGAGSTATSGSGWPTKQSPSASTSASSTGRSTSTCRAASASATRWSSSGCSGPPFCVLDEIDSGLDVDALGAVARRVEAATAEWGLGVLAVTHFTVSWSELRADAVHVLVGGRIVASGGPELAEELERTGYVGYGIV